MASVKGIKEKVHTPVYDAYFVPPGKQFDELMTDPRHIRFFVDVHGKTRHETNMQASGTLPSRNRFEARAMRVVVSPPRTPDPDLPDARKFLPSLIFGSTTTLFVGEKVMMEAPTWFFPSGAGVALNDGIPGHGNPDPQATFRFAEPVEIDEFQNFRVEIGFHHEVPSAVAKAPGPLWIWVVLDGYMERDVQ
jgi:hypothetical protein